MAITRNRNYIRTSETLVRCPLCKSEVIALGKQFFYHCNSRHLIEQNKLHNPEKVEKDNDKKVSSESLKSRSDNNQDKNSQNESSYNNLEIEEEPEEIEEEETEEKEVFHCPLCNNEVEELQDKCLNCGAVIYWEN